MADPSTSRTAPQGAAAQDGAADRGAAAPAGVSTRDRILAIALELFTEQGYDKTSIRDIAERLGTTKAALYYHFKSKADILYELHMRLHAINEALLDAFETAGDEAALVRAWPRAIDEFITAVDEHRELVRFQLRNQNALAGLEVSVRHEAANADLGQRMQGLLERFPISAETRMRITCSVGAVFAGLVLDGLLDGVPHDKRVALVRANVAQLIAA